jgi:hypothetical protein
MKRCFIITFTGMSKILCLENLTLNIGNVRKVINFMINITSPSGLKSLKAAIVSAAHNFLFCVAEGQMKVWYYKFVLKRRIEIRRW